jgi:alanyl-tRNA synthetase
MVAHATPGTPRLYFDDPTLLAFEATVVAHSRVDDRPALVLDRTAFYPDSGGQPGDAGELAGIAVEDTRCDDAGVVLHALPVGAELPPVGRVVRGLIDRDRRRLHAALHTGQHMLSRAMVDEAGAETVSSRLSAGGSTLDLDVASLDERALARAERRVAQAIEDDLAVRQWFPEPEEVASLPLRRAPKVTENIRVVDIGGFDLSPCGGTHCARTALVGVLHITGVERFKGRTRVNFLAGRAALDELRARSASLAELGRLFTCGPHDARAAVERLRSELQSTRDALGDVRARWAEGVAERLLREASEAGSSRVVLTLEGEAVETLRALGQRLTAREGVVAFLASRVDDGLLVLIARGPGSGFDCGAWLKRVAAAQQGRGGGRPDRAEGRLPGAVDWAALVAATAE